ncbi:conserved hypothetical protein [Candidatus Magnetomoraceae bacterium gMMP-15]
MVQANNADEYIAQQRAVLAQNADCGTTHYNLAVALIGQKKYDEAEVELREAVGNSPTLAEAYSQLGGLCMQRGDLDGCLAYNQRAVQTRAGFFIGYGNIGFVHLQKGEADDAIAALNKALAYNPNFIQAQTTLSSAYLMKGEIDKSIEECKKALKIDPDFPVVHNNLALAYFEKGDYEKSIEHCDKAINLGYEVTENFLNELKPYRAED